MHAHTHTPTHACIAAYIEMCIRKGKRTTAHVCVHVERCSIAPSDKHHPLPTSVEGTQSERCRTKCLWPKVGNEKGTRRAAVLSRAAALRRDTYF